MAGGSTQRHRESQSAVLGSALGWVVQAFPMLSMEVHQLSQTVYSAGFQPKTSSQSQLEGQQFAARKQTCPQRFAGVCEGTSPDTPGDIVGRSCAARAASGASQPSVRSARRGFAARAFLPSFLRVHSASRPASSPLPVPSHPGCWIPSSLLTPWGKAGRCNHRQQERESRREGGRKPITGRPRKVVEGEGRGHSSNGGTADYFAWIVEEKRELHL